VTEMVTSFDLVKEQIGSRRVSTCRVQLAGNGLRGHAIELPAVNAEDPYRNFQRFPGTITGVPSARGPACAWIRHLCWLHGAAVLRFHYWQK